MANESIKVAARKASVPLWLVGETAYNGMTDSSFSRKLRHELPDDEQHRIIEIIDQIRAEREVRHADSGEVTA